MLRKTLAIFICLNIFLSCSGCFASEADGFVPNGGLYVDAHSVCIRMPTYQFLKDQMFASDIVQNLNLFSKVMFDAGNLMSLDFANEYALLMCAILLDQDTAPERESADIAQDQYTLLSKAIEFLEKELVADDALNSAYDTVKGLQEKLARGEGLTNLEISLVDQNMKPVDTALNQTFVQYILGDLAPELKGLGMLSMTMDVVGEFSEAMTFVAAYRSFFRKEEAYKSVLEDNLAQAQSIGATKLADQLQNYLAMYHQDYRKQVFTAILEGIKENAAEFEGTASEVVAAVAQDTWRRIVPSMAEKFFVGKTFFSLTKPISATEAQHIVSGLRALGGTAGAIQYGFLAADFFLGMDIYAEGYRLLAANAVFERIHSITLNKAEDALRKNPSQKSADKFHEAFQMQKKLQMISYGIWTSWIQESRKHIHIVPDADLDERLNAAKAAQEAISALDCCKYETWLSEKFPQIYTQNDARQTHISLPEEETPQRLDAKEELRNFIFDPVALTQNDFALIDAVLIFDTSGSMLAPSKQTGTEIQRYAKQAASSFVKHLFTLNPDNRVALVRFDDESSVVRPFTGSDKEADIQSAIQNELIPTGRTNLADGFTTGASLFAQAGRTDARQIIVVLTDGMSNEGTNPIAAGKEAHAQMTGYENNIYTIGLVGALTSLEKKKVRKVLEAGYETRYFEIDGELALEGVFVTLSHVTSAAQPTQHFVVNALGDANVAILGQNGERLSSFADGDRHVSFGDLYIAGDGYEKIFFLQPGNYRYQIAGDATFGDLLLQGHMIDEKATVTSVVFSQTIPVNPGARFTGEFSDANGITQSNDLSFHPLDRSAIDPFTGKPANLANPDDVTVGSKVMFGKYVQYDTLASYQAPIKWIVLDKKDHQALLLAESGLETGAFHKKKKHVTWAESSIRKWLNQDFLNTAFSELERSAILSTTVVTPSAPYVVPSTGEEVMIAGCPDTQDFVFLLNVEEIRKYLPEENQRQSLNNPYLLSKPYESMPYPAQDDKNDFTYGYWWLRDVRSGKKVQCVFHIKSNGGIGSSGQLNLKRYVIRPAMWVNLNWPLRIVK